MATSHIRNPDDAANTGPRERTNTFTEDAVTKHVPSIIPIDNRIRTGVYFVHSGNLTLLVAAHGAGAGFLWIINHVGATSLLAIRRVKHASAPTLAAVRTNAPRVLLERFTFTGTASGATITAAKRKAADTTPANWSVRTANTGMTQTAGAAVAAFLPVVALSAAGATDAAVDTWEPDLDEMVVLAAGEGIRVYQPDAGGPTTEERKAVLDFIIEEYTEF